MPTPVYGRNLEDYSVQDLKILLKEEEERLSKVKRQIANRQKEKATGVVVTTDENGVTKRVFSEKEKAELKKCFDEIDTNGDNNINRDELKKLLTEKFDNDDWSEKQIQQAYESLDSNNDGKITFDEFLEWWATDTKKSDAKGLRMLKGKLMSGNSYLGARFCGANIVPTTTNDEDLNEYSSQVSFGDFDEKNATELRLQVLPTTPEEHSKNLDKSSEYHLWYSDTFVQSLLMMSDEKAFSAQAKAVFEVNSEDNAKKLVKSLDDALLEIVRKTIDFDGLSDEDTETLKSHGLVAEASTAAVVNKFRELCAQTVAKGAVHFDDGDLEPVDEDTPDGKLAKALIDLQDEDDDFMSALVKFEQSGNQVHIKGRLQVHGRYYQKFSNYTSILSQGLKECLFTFGIGGELSKHLSNVIEKDARILDMLNWGIRTNASVKYNSSILEDVLPLMKMLTGSSKFESINFLMSLIAGGETCSSFSQKLVFRNLFTNVERVIDFLVADARCVFQSNAGGESGYEWGPEEEDHLNELSDWAHFLAKAFQEKARPSNKMYRSSIKQALDTLKNVKDHGLIDALSSSEPKLVSVVASCPLAKAEITYTGDWRPFVLLPTKEFIAAFNQSGGLPSGESEEFLAELKERKDMIDDEVAIRELQKSFEPAMQHLEDTKGTAAMAGKEGLIFVSGLLKMLVQKPGYFYSCIFGKDDSDGDESDCSSVEFGESDSSDE
eukprot:TRINITY_DN1151_c1_g1_i1.p1 TRINITY_DN1151_c1_g1~~TRINITY_DN1151_c1_g1_i1.p1  ORF type:complete len:741 (+),score=215.71 TRINITY_DN1151_c1_g1_i1:63-2225(+)